MEMFIPYYGTRFKVPLRTMECHFRSFSVVRNAHFTVFRTMECKGLRLRSKEFTRFRTMESDRHIFHTMESTLHSMESIFRTMEWIFRSTEFCGSLM